MNLLLLCLPLWAGMYQPGDVVTERRSGQVAIVVQTFDCGTLLVKYRCNGRWFHLVTHAKKVL